ncbi:MAG: penicillin-binding protein 1A [Proteobacteria bacterium]|nr:penicillin-binding protein 1A [Pseudomonadota bacterium]
MLLFLALLGGAGVLFIFYHYGRDLPDYRQLADYEPPTVTRLHAGDGRLLVEYATEKRVYVPVQAIPRRVVNAFLSAEDKNFYSHPGVDFISVARAIVTNMVNLGRDRRPVGASTITQQVAKNFLLTNEVSMTRKVKEAILAFRIERAFDKDRILDLYLNEIYLGFGSYGVAAAALNYFNKSLDELSVAEAAYIAALPKAPNNYHPIRRPEAALARRNWVIGRMLDDGRISFAEAEEAWAQPLRVYRVDPTEIVRADYFVEEVRRELAQIYGETSLYEGGLSVRTTLDPRLQRIAERVLREGLIAYDRRHGWRGPVAKRDLEAGDWRELLAAVEPPKGIDPWTLAMVLGLDAERAEIGFPDGTTGHVPMAELTWARPWLKDQKVGAKPKKPEAVLRAGDVVLVERVAADAEGKAYGEGAYALRQIPGINGGLVALDPHTGRVLAMTGGFSYDQSQFNRATQAQRQPGSAFKPFVYLAALDSGFTPATIVLDAPFVIDQGPGQGKWKPANYSRKFYGPAPMRIGIEKSRNLMTVRLAQTIGMEKVVDTARRFGIVDDMPPVLSMALGAGETSLLRLTSAYAMLVNGGRRIDPTLIDRIQDRHGLTIFRHDMRGCEGCQGEAWANQEPPELPDERERVADPASAYQVVSMLQGVVQRGTGRRVRAVGKPLAGKTGTTNESKDTWFMGFSPDLAVGVFAGFDEPRPLGRRETGSSVSAPIFRDFMAAALEGQPAIPFRIPPGIRLVRINAETGRVARAGDKRVILEAFKPGTVPSGDQAVIDGGYNPMTGTATGGTSGLY